MEGGDDGEGLLEGNGYVTEEVRVGKGDDDDAEMVDQSAERKEDVWLDGT